MAVVMVWRGKTWVFREQAQRTQAVVAVEVLITREV